MPARITLLMRGILAGLCWLSLATTLLSLALLMISFGRVILVMQYHGTPLHSVWSDTRRILIRDGGLTYWRESRHLAKVGGPLIAPTSEVVTRWEGYCDTSKYVSDLPTIPERSTTSSKPTPERGREVRTAVSVRWLPLMLPVVLFAVLPVIVAVLQITRARRDPAARASFWRRLGVSALFFAATASLVVLCIFALLRTPWLARLPYVSTSLMMRDASEQYLGGYLRTFGFSSDGIFIQHRHRNPDARGQPLGPAVRVRRSLSIEFSPRMEMAARTANWIPTTTSRYRFLFEKKSRDWILAVPYWALCVVFALLPTLALPAAWRRHRQRRREAAGLCPICGYDLRATPGMCPECGTPRRGERV